MQSGVLEIFRLWVFSISGWITQRQNDYIDYLIDENRILRSKIKTKRIRFTDKERIRLALKAKKVGRKKLQEIATIASPDTLLRWYRELLARKWTYKRKRVGRPRTKKDTEELILRMAKENETWGYTRIQGALKNLKIKISRTTILNILRRNGMGPAPERSKRKSWKTFIRSHMELIAATDFFTVEVMTLKGLVTYYVLIFMELSSRKVKVAGITPNPNGPFMVQMARNLTDYEEGFLLEKKYLIHDRDGKYTEKFDEILDDEKIKVIKLPVRSPNLNAHAERIILSIKTEALNRFVIIGENMLQKILSEYTQHYHQERNH